MLLKIQNMMGVKGLALIVYNFFDKKSASAGGVKNENMSNKELDKELYKQIIIRFYFKLLENFKTKSTIIFYRQCSECLFC